MCRVLQHVYRVLQRAVAARAAGRARHVHLHRRRRHQPLPLLPDVMGNVKVGRCGDQWLARHYHL